MPTIIQSNIMKFINNDPLTMKKIAQKLAVLLKHKRTKITTKKPKGRAQQNKIKQFLKKQQSENQSLDVKIDSEEYKKLQNPSFKQLPEMPVPEQMEEDSDQLQPLNHNIGSQQKPSWYFSQKKFTQFELSQPTFKALQKNGFQMMTHIQSRTLNYLLKGRDVLGAAKTGSGKTLAYLIPCIQLLRRFEFKQQNGTGVIIITPTRQLAIQVYEVAKRMMEFHNKTVGLLIGGNKRKPESIRLEKGVNLLICTPGRLLDHLHNSKFIYHNLLSLVIDEADAILRIGFQQELLQILKVLPTERQTILFSATQTRQIDDLAKLSLKEPLYIGVDDTDQKATVQNLEQGFVIINAADKFRLLLTFLRKQKKVNKKIMVFFSSCNSVKFYSDLLNYIDINVMEIHGKQKQQKRSTTFYEFGTLKEGILLCTDVAARGLDIPQVDWIVQFDPPLDIKEYIHRVGRTCRGSHAKGKALLFLLEEQRQYLNHLIRAKVELNEYEFSSQSLENVQEDFETLIDKNSYLQTQAKNAYKSYLHAYTTYSIKNVFNIHSLDLKSVAKSFGLVKPPFVQLNVKLGGAKNRKFKMK